MDELIFKLYLNKLGEERSFENTFRTMTGKEKFQFIFLIFLLVLVMLCIIIGFFNVKIMRLFWIPLLIFGGTLLYLNEKQKTENAINNQITINVENRKLLLDTLLHNGINENNNIKNHYDRLFLKLNNYRLKVDETKERIFSFFKVLIIPSVLAFFNKLTSDDIEYIDLFSTITLCVILIAVIMWVCFLFYNMYLDITKQYYKNLEEYLLLLQDIINFEKFDKNGIICIEKCNDKIE